VNEPNVHHEKLVLGQKSGTAQLQKPEQNRIARPRAARPHQAVRHADVIRGLGVVLEDFEEQLEPRRLVDLLRPLRSRIG